jgi:hypothetical protein
MCRGFLLVASVLIASTLIAAEPDKDGWVTIFDGKSLDGWEANENKEGFKVEDGAIVVSGPRNHLFYTGDKEPFVNFELELDVMTKPGANSGVYFHTQFQKEGWPKYGYEAQVNMTQGDPVKTGSIYGTVKILEAPAKDNEWFKYRIKVDGKKITTSVNDKVLVEYEEPEGKQPGSDFTRVLDKGTFALQAHDPQSVVLYRNIRVKRLK